MKNFVQDGKRLGLVESGLVHPVHTDGLVRGGDQIVEGQIVGVAAFDAGATTDIVTIQTEGVFTLSVTGTDAGGNSAVAIGDALYIDSGAAAAITKNATKTRFGTALAAVNSAATASIAVKIVGQN